MGLVIPKGRQMTRFIIALVGILVLLPPGQARAADKDKQAGQALPPPPLPQPLESGKSVEPEVSIVHTDKAVVEEYRVNGHLYMIKITPKIGKPYYLIDENGDGQWSGKISNIYNPPRVPQWVLFSW